MDNFTDVDDIVKTRKGAPSIVFEGFTFRKDRADERGHSIFWRCRHKGCPGRLVSDESMRRAKLTKPHQGHLPNKNIGKAEKVVEKMKERVTKEKIPVNRIYREEMREVVNDPEVLELIPTFAKMKSAFYKSRKQTFGAVPESLEKLEIPEQLQRLESGENFLLFQEEGNQIIVFGTDKDFCTVCSSDELFVDGTFDAVPSFFSQLFTIHTFNGEKQFPRLYCFLGNKTAEIYTRLIAALKDLATRKGLEFSPRRITSDFEGGWISAVGEALPTTSINGCFFHFTQAIIRKISSMGMMQKYKEDQAFRDVVRQMIGLAFLPVNKVLTTLTSITNETHDEQTSKFIEYFMVQWVVRTRLEMWNVRGRVHRTNNDVESWHNRLNLDVGKCKNVFFIIQTLINDHIDSSVLEQQLAKGLVISTGKLKHAEKDQTIANLERDLETGRKDEREFCLAVGSLMVK